MLHQLAVILPLPLHRQSLLAHLKVKSSHALSLALDVIPLKSVGWNICPCWVSLKILSWGLTEELDCSVTHPPILLFLRQHWTPPSTKDCRSRDWGGDWATFIIKQFQPLMKWYKQTSTQGWKPVTNPTLAFAVCYQFALEGTKNGSFFSWSSSAESKRTLSETLTCSLNTFPKNSHNCLNSDLRSQKVNCLPSPSHARWKSEWHFMAWFIPSFIQEHSPREGSESFILSKRFIHGNWARCFCTPDQSWRCFLV